MREIETLLGIEDVMRIFGLSRVSVYRRVGEARQGKSRFPLPVSTAKQKLKWSAADIEAFCQSGNATQPLANNSSVEQQGQQMRDFNLTTSENKL